MNEVTQEVIEEFKLRIKLDGNEEDENLRRILVASIADLIMKTGQYTIEDSGVFRELVFERARYVYNDALEYFDTNFVAQITALAIGNIHTLDGGGGSGEGGAITVEDITAALGYVPANNNDLTAFINRYNAEITQTNTLAMGNQNRINALDNRVTAENTALSNRVQTNETSIISLTNGIQANTNRIDALENSPSVETYDDTEVRGLITNNSDRITVLENVVPIDLNPLTNRVSQNETNISTIQNRLVTQENRTNSIIRQDTTSQLGTEVVNSLPTSNLYQGRIVFDQSDNRFKGYNGGEWL